MTDLLEIAERVAARAEPGEQVEAFVARSSSTAVRVHGGEVESFTSATAAGIGVRVVRDRRTGFAYAASLEPDIAAATLAEARDNRAFAEPDEWAGVAQPDEVPSPDLDLWRSGLLSVAPAAKVAMALDLERTVRGLDRRITGVRTATYGDTAGRAAVATSTGIAVTSSATRCQVSVVAMATDGGETQVGIGVQGGREPGELSVDAAAEDAAARALRLLGARKPPTQRLTIVLEPRLAATLLSIVGGMFAGDRVLKGRTPFADRLGDGIASPLLSLVDDPTDASSLTADTYDGEGIATRRSLLIGHGVLQSFLHDSYTGRRSGTATTGSAVRGFRSTPSPGPQALTVVPGRGDLDGLVAGVGQGLLVQSMNGLHSGINQVSGDFSVGVDGLLIRGGEPGEPVREATIASTLQRLLLDVSAVGADLEWQPGGDAGVTLVIDDVQLSGT